MTAIALPKISSTQKGSVSKEILEIAQRDYRHMLQMITANEIGQQRSLKNPPTGMLIDRSKSKPLSEITRSAVVWFADKRSLVAAIMAAKDALIKNGRKLTGETAGAAKIMARSSRNGPLTEVGDPTAYLASHNPRSVDFYVMIAEPHVRKWQYLTATGRRRTRATRNKVLTRYAKAAKIAPLRVASSGFATAARSVQRQFRNLDVFDTYLRVPNLNPQGATPVDRVPAIKVRMKVRGRI